MAQTRMWRIRPAVARFVNPVLRPLAGWLPSFGVVVHRGRRSGRVYRTPVNVFRRDEFWLFVLTYGSDAHWVHNVVAAGGCTLHTRGRDLELVDPEIIYDPRLSPVPGFARFVERHVAGAAELLRMRAAPSR